MEEDVVKTKVPEIYQSIIKTEEDVDWEQIKEDLEELNWLFFDDLQASETIISVWKVADKYGVSVLQGTPRFKLFKIQKVKLIITNYVYNIEDSSDISLICKESRGKIEEMLFFSCARGMMYMSSEESLPNLTLRIFDIFTEFKTMISHFFIHFDKQLKYQINTTIGALLDEIFYIKVLKEFKEKLNDNENTKKIISDLGSKVTERQNYETPNNVYASQATESAGTNWKTGTGNTVSSGTGTGYNYYFTNEHTVYLRENLYTGELSDENKRHGYGKITFFGGDTYEGFWENDRPHGEGLYIWKIGGKYLGEFTKGNISGVGKRVYPSGNYYVGEFLNGKKHGKGEMNFKNGDVYEGSWEDDYMSGDGKFSWSTGDFFVGKFIKDMREGRGVLTMINGDIVEGSWKDNQFISN